MEGLHLHVLYASILCCLRITKAGDSVTLTLPLIDGQTLVSSGGRFELGFFSPQGSPNRYLGIWYKELTRDQGVVWVANRETPLGGSNGTLKISNNGNLILLNQTGSIVWSSNSSMTTQHTVSAQLLNSGNLVLKDLKHNTPVNYLWQSFDHVCDTLIPGMKLGRNLKTGMNWFLSSWKTTSDAPTGGYRLGIDLHGVPQLMLWEGEELVFRGGYWNGVRFAGLPEMKPSSLFPYKFVSNEEEVYFTLDISNQSGVGQLITLNQFGDVSYVSYNARLHNWFPNHIGPIDQCQDYNYCGAYGSCNISNAPVVCQCLHGFMPKSSEEWNSMDYSSGCIQRASFSCRNGEGFQKFSGIKVPDTKNVVLISKIGLMECEAECLNNCSCTAFALADRKEGNGCLLWFGHLVDIRSFQVNGQELYVKMAASQLEVQNGGSADKKKLVAAIASASMVLGILAVAFIIWCFVKRTKMRRLAKENIDHSNDGTTEAQSDLKLPLFDFDTVATATNNFSNGNIIGKGGFGPVYKGELSTGQEIAVKRLSKNSEQGLNEFKNEVILIVKLQHRNLVRLLGCCIQREEMILVYEYLPNKSLDYFIFDLARSKLLSWHKRFDIIVGIAQGLLYLHRDSTLRIIHRDLKASNVLLDSKMNPKISDFGLARAFGGDETEANTRRVVGTYGYMSPEYAAEGLFSMKSDVFSFGVLILEIVSGKRNKGFHHLAHYLNLLSHAWNLWNEGKALELVDATIVMEDELSKFEFLRCIQVGLLCVQQCPDDRPMMSSVVMMLGSDYANLPQPKQPGFYYERSFMFEVPPSSERFSFGNKVSFTRLEGR